MKNQENKSITIYQSLSRHGQGDKLYGFDRIYNIPNDDTKQLVQRKLNN